MVFKDIIDLVEKVIYIFKNAVNCYLLTFNYSEEQLRSLIKDTFIETEFKDLELFDEIFNFKN